MCSSRKLYTVQVVPASQNCHPCGRDRPGKHTNVRGRCDTCRGEKRAVPGGGGGAVGAPRAEGPAGREGCGGGGGVTFWLILQALGWVPSAQGMCHCPCKRPGLSECSRINSTNTPSVKGCCASRTTRVLPGGAQGLEVRCTMCIRGKRKKCSQRPKEGGGEG